MRAPLRWRFNLTIPFVALAALFLMSIQVRAENTAPSSEAGAVAAGPCEVDDPQYMLVYLSSHNVWDMPDYVHFIASSREAWKKSDEKGSDRFECVLPSIEGRVLLLITPSLTYRCVEPSMEKLELPGPVVFDVRASDSDTSDCLSAPAVKSEETNVVCTMGMPMSIIIMYEFHGTHPEEVWRVSSFGQERLCDKDAAVRMAYDEIMQRLAAHDLQNPPRMTGVLEVNYDDQLADRGIVRIR